VGYKEKELKGAAISKLFAAQEVKKGMVEEILREENLKNKDIVFRTKDGRDIPVLFSCSVLTDDAGTKGGIVCIARDISERKKLEEEVLRSKKLESIGILAGGIAHDFNNLLSVVMGNISLAQDEILPREKAHKFLETAEEASLKAAGLAGKFITFSAGGWLKKERVVLANVLKEARRLEVPGPADRNIDYDIDIPVDLMPINGDERQLVQVLQNLFLNALEAVPEGKADISISLRAENTTITSNNEYLLEPGTYVKVLVADNGMGIPEKNIENVFDPYFSTKEKNSRKGMGLGLTICYSIIKKHKGHITLESRTGKGTTVTFYLPAFL
jgi:signal transduction histidine kinase